MKKLKVLLVDDEIMIREGFKKLFDWNAHDCEVVGEAADGMEAMMHEKIPYKRELKYDAGLDEEKTLYAVYQLQVYAKVIEQID